MANSLLTPTVILKEAGRLFHQKARFISAINRQYDDKFARDGAKVGYSISLRDRNTYTVTTGATLAVQDTTESSQTLTVNTQKHVGMNFTSADLTMVIDEFSDRYIKPAMAVLVANVEADSLISMRKKVAQIIDDDGNSFSYLDVAKSKQKLDEHLTPDDDRTLLLCPTHATKYLDATKGLFVPGKKLGDQYDSGMVQDLTGYQNIAATTHLTAHQTGTAAKTTGYSVDNAGTTSGATITLKTGSTTFLVGDIITVATLNDVHPETKADLGYLKQFTVTADSGANATSLSISPAIVYTGAKKNVSTASLGADRAVVKLCAGASETQVESLAFHKDAFVFGSVDLEDMSKYGGWGAVEAMDGLSMRIWRQGDIVNDAAPCRIDVLYGFLARYPQMACRMHADG